MSIVIESLMNVVLQFAIFITPVLIVYLFRRKKIGTSIFNWLGLRKVPVTKGLMGAGLKTFLLCLIIMLAPIYTMIYFKWIDFDLFAAAGSLTSGPTLSNIIAVLIKAWLQTALIEEVFFRGFIGKALLRKTNRQLANLIQGLIFGLPHGLPLILVTGNHLAGMVLIISASLVGMLQLNLNEIHGKGSIWPSVVVHGIMNTLSFGARLF